MVLIGAADVFRDLGYAPFQAHALEDAAVAAAEAGDEDTARASCATALELYADLGASWDIRRATARLRRFGIRPSARSLRTRPATGWQALTPTEITVAELISAGKSNPDIAVELYLSRNTVQTHVSRILKKLDARTRVDIARRAMIERQRAR